MKSRRTFLKSTAASAAVVGFPTIVPSSVFGQNAPSNRITMGVVGWGMMGPGNTNNFIGQKDCQVVATCDIDKNALKSATDRVNGKYKNKDCKAYHDYKEMLARDDIDSVMLAVPDNWHCLTAVDAANAGKDIYGEKPLARTVAEQQAIVSAVQKNKRVWQTGSWQRSVSNFHKACEVVRSGLLGKIKRVEIGLPSGHHDFAGTKDKMSVTDPPGRLDYKTWIGPATMQPYVEGRIHKNWRWDYNIGGGQLLDWIGHHCDIAHWGMDWDNTGPVEVEGHGEFPPRDAVWNTSTKYRIECLYPDGTPVTIAGGHGDIKGGTKWIGENGWVHVNRGQYDASNEDWKQKGRLPKELRGDVELLDSPGHHRNFLDCVKSRQKTITPVEAAHHSAVPGHLGLISMMLGRAIKWDPVKEVIANDPEATKLLGRDYQNGYKLPTA